MWGKLVRRGGTRQLVGAACASMSVCSLWMLGWCCVLRAWVCLLLERQRCWDGRGLTYVCAGTARERAPGGGSRGCVLERSWYGAWVTHPDRRQSSGVSRSCWEMSQPLETPQPKLCRPASLLTICCWNTTGAFFFSHRNCLLLGETHYLKRLCTCDSDWGWLIRKKSLYILMQE